MPRRLAILISCLFAVSVSPVAAQQGDKDSPARLLFETDVQPLLAKRCGKCHSAKVQKGSLDLSTMGSLRRGGESEEDLVGASIEESLLWSMVEGGDMPPDDEPPLTDRERSLLRRWISTGAAAKEPLKTERSINQHDVFPILLLRCNTCHGPRMKRGNLDLRTRAAMLRGGASGPALKPGDPDNSLMIQRVESSACPPRDSLLKYFVKRPPPSEVKVLRAWIAAGAAEEEISPDIASQQLDPLVSAEDRRHWAFRSPQTSGRHDSIDGFILAKLRERSLGFSPEADRDTLIRRAHLDLIGMPPTIAEWKRWRSRGDSQWYGEMIDHLLESPHYGERWGRYWLDLAGYADSEGGVSADPLRKVAWKYRDYVIRAFNSDKPYDRFLIEQLAGDELIDHENAEEVTSEMVDNLVATGFLRMGIDQTGSRTMNFVSERLGVISDAITVMGEGLMGLTMSCARCHSHKYDPIPQRDYYRFKAVFQGAFDEHDWLTFKNRLLRVDIAERRRRVAKVNPPLLAQSKKLAAQLKKATTDVRLELLKSHYPEQSGAEREATIRALRVADNNRSQPQRILVEMLQQVEVMPAAQQPAPVIAAQQVVADLEQRLADVNRRLEPPLEIRALWDRGDPSPTYILRRGEYNKPGRLVGPGVPSVLTDGRTPFEAQPPFPDGTPKTGRRLAFAQWLTAPDHPLTSRVMANRLWYHHFGVGLVKSLENFGVKGDKPTHPELLDWLAVRFVQSGWSIKSFHRQIMNSRTYRQTSRITEELREADPQNRLLSRFSLRRMDAEALRDSLLFVAGRLDAKPGGPPDSVSVGRDGQVSVNPTPAGRWRRSVYLQYRRTDIPTMMSTFDYPEMGPNCLTRSISTVSPQSLLLMNNRHVRDLAGAFADRVESIHADDSPDDMQSRVETAYQLALSRPPSDVERKLGVESLTALRAAWRDKPRAAMETYCHTILNSAAFLYID